MLHHARRNKKNKYEKITSVHQNDGNKNKNSQSVEIAFAYSPNKNNENNDEKK